jgi:methylenetetrahydrofolate dehydrogenase (NADP+)/methenyltetrahydrofolate cyclohydrolase
MSFEATQWLDGKTTSAILLDALAKARIELDQTKPFKPGLAVVLIGEDPASQIYVSRKQTTALSLGFASQLVRLPKEINFEALADQIHLLNNDPSIHAILIQLPLPNHLPNDAVLELIAPHKDVDGFNPGYVGRLALGKKTLVPCTALGCLMLLRHYQLPISGKHAVILGRSAIVGRPLANLFLAQDATVTLCHSKTQNIPELCRQADILAVAIGKPLWVQKDWVKPGAIVIDVGIHRCEKNPKQLVGDVASVVGQASWVTPVPGGVGPMTIACLMHNGFFLALAQEGRSLSSSCPLFFPHF